VKEIYNNKEIDISKIDDTIKNKNEEFLDKKQELFDKINKESKVSFNEFNDYRDKVMKAKTVYIYYQNDLNLFYMNNKEKYNKFNDYKGNRKRDIDGEFGYENEDYIKMFEGTEIFKDDEEKIEFGKKYHELKKKYNKAKSKYDDFKIEYDKYSFKDKFEQEFKENKLDKSEEEINKLNSIKLLKNKYNKIESEYNKSLDVKENYEKIKVNIQTLEEKHNEKHKYNIIKDYGHIKNIYENKESIKCDFSDKKYKHINKIIKKFMEKMGNNKNQEAVGLIKSIITQRMNPINMRGRSFGVSSFNEIDKLVKNHEEKIIKYNDNNDNNEDVGNNNDNNEDIGNNDLDEDNIVENEGNDDEYYKEDGHFYQIKNFVDLAREIGVLECKMRHVERRGNNIACSINPSISKSNNIIGLINYTLELFNEKDISIDDE